jgi:4-amino-4-deoxy-L-arabinose transferase-like glycosyltransferase
MAVSDPARRRIVALLVGALGVLLARFVALQFGASQAVGTAFYAVAVLCLVGCVLVLARDSR